MGKILIRVLIMSAFFFNSFLVADNIKTPSSSTKVIVLGSGNPNPDPEHSGCSLAIIVNNTPYIIDFGPGLVRQAASLSTDFGGPFKALNIQNLKQAFVPAGRKNL